MVSPCVQLFLGSLVEELQVNIVIFTQILVFLSPNALNCSDPVHFSSNGVLSSLSTTTIPDERFPAVVGGGFPTTKATIHQADLEDLTVSVVGEIVLF